MNQRANANGMAEPRREHTNPEFSATLRRANGDGRKVLHMESEPQALEQSESIEKPEVKPLRLSDWLWQPWYAKLWWSAIPIYWAGRMASLEVPALTPFYDTLLANYLALFCNPFILLLLLGAGFVRAKLDRGEWILAPDVPVWQQRKPGEMLDPFTDPSDPRSGPRHLRHIGVLKDGVH